jgi:hypothetical protein
MRFKKIRRIRKSLLEPGEQTGYTALGLKKMRSGQSIKVEICFSFFLLFILSSQPKRPTHTDALRSVQEFGFIASQKQTLSSTARCAPSMNDTFCVIPAFLKGYTTFRLLFEKKFISLGDSLFRKRRGGD